MKKPSENLSRRLHFPDEESRFPWLSMLLDSYRAFMATLPFYGITDENDKIHFIENNLIHAQAFNLQSYDWRKLVKVMDDFDSKKSGM
ncbi:MAG TPA: hypothetical protein DD713_00180 [Nitrospiraceae bacterium]|nr:hypothetical protein [Nitrospiraceae bacterium]